MAELLPLPLVNINTINSPYIAASTPSAHTTLAFAYNLLLEVGWQYVQLQTIVCSRRVSTFVIWVVGNCIGIGLYSSEPMILWTDSSSFVTATNIICDNNC